MALLRIHMRISSISPSVLREAGASIAGFGGFGCLAIDPQHAQLNLADNELEFEADFGCVLQLFKG